MLEIDTILLILVLLQIKHWYIDFVNQTDEEINNKGIYLDVVGMLHSLKHGALTTLILAIFVSPMFALQLGAIDFILHYHIDYLKMRFGNRDITTKTFWVHLGTDQLAHQLTYLLLIVIIAAKL
jgi:hypothetical protein